MRINLNTDLCVGAGQCALGAPDLFDQDEDGIVEQLTDGIVTGDHLDQAREAAYLCPSRAISLVPDSDPDTLDHSPVG